MSLVLERFSVVDLTHPLHEGVPTWTGRCGFRLEIKIDYEEGLRAQTQRGHAGVGTHMDAPSHFVRGGANIGDIPLEKLIVPLCVLDLRNRLDPDLLVSPQDLSAYEAKYGAIPEGSLVCAMTGWEKYWNDPDRYRNPDEKGKMHFPGFSAESAAVLVERKVAGIGIDTLSPDGSNDGFPVHEIILGAGKYILENLAQLSRMPARGAFAIVFPPRTRDASESPIRAAGLIPV